MDQQMGRKDMPFAGAAEPGIVNPIAFLVVGEDKIKLLPVQYNSTVDESSNSYLLLGELQNMIGKGQKNKQG